MRWISPEHPQGCRRAIAIMGQGAAFTSTPEQFDKLPLLI